MLFDDEVKLLPDLELVDLLVAAEEMFEGFFELRKIGFMSWIARGTTTVMPGGQTFEGRGSNTIAALRALFESVLDRRRSPKRLAKMRVGGCP